MERVFIDITFKLIFILAQYVLLCLVVLQCCFYLNYTALVIRCALMLRLEIKAIALAINLCGWLSTDLTGRLPIVLETCSHATVPTGIKHILLLLLELVLERQPC